MHRVWSEGHAKLRIERIRRKAANNVAEIDRVDGDLNPTLGKMSYDLIFWYQGNGFVLIF